MSDGSALGSPPSALRWFVEAISPALVAASFAALLVLYILSETWLRAPAERGKGAPDPAAPRATAPAADRRAAGSEKNVRAAAAPAAAPRSAELPPASDSGGSTFEDADSGPASSRGAADPPEAPAKAPAALSAEYATDTTDSAPEDDLAPSTSHTDVSLDAGSQEGELRGRLLSTPSGAPAGFASPSQTSVRTDELVRILQDARELVGWRVEVAGYGTGIVEDTSKLMKGRPTKFTVRFGDGRVEKLSLKRSKSKGKIPFKLRGPTKVALRRMTTRREREGSAPGAVDATPLHTTARSPVPARSTP